jgi:hypothetical protein
MLYEDERNAVFKRESQKCCGDLIKLQKENEDKILFVSPLGREPLLLLM